MSIVNMCPLTKFEGGFLSLFSVDDDAGNRSNYSAREMKLVVQIFYDAAERHVLHMSEHITSALISLHWLRVPERIIFKVATLTFRALHGTVPPYMTSQFTGVADMPNRQRLRSAHLISLMFHPSVCQLLAVVPF